MPYRADQYPTKNWLSSLEAIDADLALFVDWGHAVRTYTEAGELAEVPRLAAAHVVNVALGVWLDANRKKNAEELKRPLKVAERNYRNVVRVLVANKTLSLTEPTPWLERKCCNGETLYRLARASTVRQDGDRLIVPLSDSAEVRKRSRLSCYRINNLSPNPASGRRPRAVPRR